MYLLYSVNVYIFNVVIEIKFYSVLLYSILFYYFLLFSILFYSFYYILLYSILFKYCNNHNLAATKTGSYMGLLSVFFVCLVSGDDDWVVLL